MSWALGDEVTKTQAKVDLSKARSAVYTLAATVRRVNHEEKRAVMEKYMVDVFNALDQVDKVLNR